jgi:hypothetical protein
MILSSSSRASVQGAKALHNILNLYENASGQMINKDKIAAMFSLNTSEQNKNQMLIELSIV